MTDDIDIVCSVEVDCPLTKCYHEFSIKLKWQIFLYTINFFVQEFLFVSWLATIIFTWLTWSCWILCGLYWQLDKLRKEQFVKQIRLKLAIVHLILANVETPRVRTPCLSWPHWSLHLQTVPPRTSSLHPTRLDWLRLNQFLGTPRFEVKCKLTFVQCQCKWYGHHPSCVYSPLRLL